MPALVNNPEKLTVQQLRRELQRKNVSIPGKARKDTYVQLYRKHILKEGRGLGPGFSSDEDDDYEPYQKVTVRRSQVYQTSPSSSIYTPSARKGAYKIIFQDKLSDVEDLTDRRLRSELVRRGVPAGPILASTRQVYERKLADVLVQEVERGEQTRSQSTMVSFHDDEDEDEDYDEEEDEDYDEEEEVEEEEEEDEFSDSDQEKEKPLLSGRGDSRLQKRSTHHEETSSSHSTVYQSSRARKSRPLWDAKPWRYCWGLPLFLWWLVIIAAVIGFVYCVWLSMEDASTQPSLDNKQAEEKSNDLLR